jgi:Uncharacterised protein family (UPF0014)
MIGIGYSDHQQYSRSLSPNQLRPVTASHSLFVNSLEYSLEVLDLAWALGLIAISIGLAQWQRLGLAGQMAIAAARSILQLLVMGFGLQLVWQLDRDDNSRKQMEFSNSIYTHYKKDMKTNISLDRQVS